MDPRLRRFFSIDRAELSRPYFLATVAVVIGWIAVNSDAALLRFDLLGSLVRDARLEGPGVTPILVYATYPASVALFGSAVYLLRRERLLSVYYAASAPVLESSSSRSSGTSSARSRRRSPQGRSTSTSPGT